MMTNGIPTEDPSRKKTDMWGKTHTPNSGDGFTFDDGAYTEWALQHAIKELGEKKFSIDNIFTNDKYGLGQENLNFVNCNKNSF